MKDINDYLPKLPPNSWGAMLNWIPSKVEFDNIAASPFPFNSRWHKIDKVPGHNELLIDGKVIKQSDDSKLT